MTIEPVAHDAPHEVPEAHPDSDVTVIERRGLLIAHGESGAALPEEAFDHRADRDARGALLWRRAVKVAFISPKRAR